MSLALRQLRVIECDEDGCGVELVTDAADSVEARFFSASEGWGYRPTKRNGPKPGSIRRADFCPAHTDGV